MDTKSTLRILLVGGGTGGHFYPLISLAEALNALPERPALYYGGPEPYDREALRKEGISFIRIPAGKTRRYRSILNVLDIFRTAFGLLVALVRLFILYPDVIVSKGGHTSVPVVLAGVFFRIPIVVHESDAVVGRANRLAARFARRIIVSYEETLARFPGRPVVRLGIPVRNAFLKDDAGRPVGLDIPEDRPVLLVIGGSQGAERINGLVLDSLDELLSGYTIIHQTGKKHFELCKLSAEGLITNEEHKRYYRPAPFLDAETLHEAYRASRLVISRAGSTSIYEIAIHGKPSILIPIPEEISHDQRSNAYAYAQTGAATVLEEKNLTDSLLQAEIDRIMQDAGLYESMAKAASAFPIRDSAPKIAGLILEVAKEH